MPAALPAPSLAELLALARARPGGLDDASAGIGTGSHLVGALVAQRSGVPMTHVPYAGTAQAMNALASGEVQLFSDAAGTPAELARCAAAERARWTEVVRAANIRPA
ncbi:MAG: hypothetical protein K2X11_22370 [Acetobacteraceae bacterium]|nr:hypothetical protein [Acetobacteraceae bacterium]